MGRQLAEREPEDERAIWEPRRESVTYRNACNCDKFKDADRTDFQMSKNHINSGKYPPKIKSKLDSH